MGRLIAGCLCQRAAAATVSKIKQPAMSSAQAGAAAVATCHQPAASQLLQEALPAGHPGPQQQHWLSKVLLTHYYGKATKGPLQPVNL